MARIAIKQHSVIPPDVYTAKIQTMTEETTEFGPAVKFGFMVTSGEFAGDTVSALASIPSGGLGPRAKLRRWAEAILGRSLADEADFDPMTLITRQCRITVVVVSGKDNSEFNRVSDVLGTPRPTPRRVEATEVDAAEAPAAASTAF